MNIAILTWHYYTNYGSVLQAYALQEFLIEQGYNVTVLDYRKPEYNGCRLSRMLRRHKLLYKYFCQLFNRKKAYSFYRFICEKLHMSTEIMYANALEKEIQKHNAIIVGSDQIWAPNVFNPVYMLDFVPDDILKISYAASIGLNQIPDDLISTYQKLLSRFHAISVREKQGAQLLDQRCGIKSEVVLDPTLLVNIDHWKQLEKKVKRNDKYIFCYFLNKNHRYKESVQEYAKKKDIEVIGCSANSEDASWMTVLGNEIGPCEFLWLIHHAEAVFTDSYHGTIFSLLYHKPFITFERFANTDKICQNSRIYQLDDHFNLARRIIKIEDTELIIEDYDYDMFEHRLDVLRKSSLEFLRKALEG